MVQDWKQWTLMMAAILGFDLALVGLLLTSTIGRVTHADRAEQWFAACLFTGMLTLLATWLAGQPIQASVYPVFALCNAAGLLIGPCLILYARALANRNNHQRTDSSRPSSWLGIPFGLVLLVYAAAGSMGIEPGQYELWIAISKSISLTVSVVIAIATIVRCRKLTPLRLGHHADMWCTIAAVMIGLSTLPAALIGGDDLVQDVYSNAVFPALAVCLWLLIGWRLHTFASPPEILATGRSPSPSAPAVDPRHLVPDAAVLTAVFQAFVQSVETNHSWLEADFGLDDAARQLGIRRHLLSEAINQHVPGGFSTALNDYRMAAFRSALATAPQDESVLAIGLRCGFGSKASLHRLVKRNCGLSPGELRNAIREERKVS